MAELIHKKESYVIMGACFEVYKEKGHGFVEPIYQECLEIEMKLRNIPFETQQALPLVYKGTSFEASLYSRSNMLRQNYCRA